MEIVINLIGLLSDHVSPPAVISLTLFACILFGMYKQRQKFKDRDTIEDLITTRNANVVDADESTSSTVKR